jgi:hypothetical protein
MEIVQRAHTLRLTITLLTSVLGFVHDHFPGKASLLGPVSVMIDFFTRYFSLFEALDEKTRGPFLHALCLVLNSICVPTTRDIYATMNEAKAINDPHDNAIIFESMHEQLQLRRHLLKENIELRCFQPLDADNHDKDNRLGQPHGFDHPYREDGMTPMPENEALRLRALNILRFGYLLRAPPVSTATNHQVRNSIPAS